MSPPGPRPLGRGVVVEAADDVPPAWRDAAVVTIDEAGLSEPGPPSPACTPPGRRRNRSSSPSPSTRRSFRRPQSINDEPWRLGPNTEPWFDRLHFLVWANTYDARAAASRCGGGASRRPGWTTAPRRPRPAPGDVRLADGSAVWIDGGPRRPWAPATSTGWPSSTASRSTSAGSRSVPAPVAPDAPTSPRTSSPPSPTSPGRPGSSPRPGRARRGCSPSGCATSTATAATSRRPRSRSPTTSRPSWRWRPARPTSGPASARSTRSGCGCWPSTAARSPPVLDERDVRRLVESLVPGRRPRRANTDPIGPYVEGLALGPARPARPGRGRGVARRRPRARRAVPPLPRPSRPSAASSTSTSRSTAPSRCCSRDGAVPPLDAALVPPPARRRVPGPHAGPRAAAPPARPAGPRRVRRRRRRPVHLRPRRRRPGVPDRLRPAVPRRRRRTR